MHPLDQASKQTARVIAEGREVIVASEKQLQKMKETLARIDSLLAELARTRGEHPER
jgi:hypothetical protein